MFKYSKLLTLTSLLLVFTSCEEETFDPVLTLGAPAELTAPAAGSSFVITEDQVDADFATFTWSEADFGFDAGASYSVEVDLAGNGFADAKALVSAVNATTAVVKNATVNNFLINGGVPGGVAQDIEVRVVARVGTAADNNVITSDPVTLSVTPFEAEIDYPKIYVPGAHQGWDPETAPNLFSVPDNGKYDGFVYFADDNNEYKFTTNPDWTENFGDTGADGTLDPNGDNIAAGTGGLYRLNVDVNGLTYSATRTDWGIIGSATPTGWDSDTDLVYNTDTGILSVTIDLVPGEFKFRANDEWMIDFGDNGADLKLDYGGDNIVLEEGGNYTVELDLGKAIPTYSLTKN